MTIDEILAAIEPHKCNLVEITGGEPMLQSEVPQLSAKLLDKGHTVLIETGGSIDVSGLPTEVVKILDIKCPESGMTEHMNWENLKYLSPKDEIKFVINSRKDYEWSKEIMNRYQLNEKNLILFSPVYQKMPADQLADWILADNLPVRFQIQLHKTLWGETPGR
jgi:7-carboxy-7-deazaguanine synthase